MQYILFQPFMFLFGFGYACFVNWRLALVVSLVLPGLMWLVSRISRMIEGHAREVQRRHGDVNIVVKDSISGLNIIKTNNAADRVYRSISRKLDGVVRHEIRIAWWRTLAAPLQGMNWLLPQLFLYLVGGLFIIRRLMDFDELVVFTRLMPYITYPFGYIMDAIGSLREVTPAAERLFAVIDTPPAVYGDSICVRDPEFAIRCEDLVYGYQPETTVIDDLSLSVRRGERIVIVGPSGSGKSTLIKLIAGFYGPVAGRILVGQTPLSELRRDELCNIFVYVSQHSFLFNDTVINNLRCVRPGATMEQIRTAAERAYCIDFIEALPNGWETVIGERGAGISGGEKQRLTIARAILRDAPVVLMDEPTAALDTDAATMVRRGMAELAADRTVIAVSHRVDMVRSADRIVVMDRGKIIDTGTHTQLSSREGLYVDLFGSPNAGVTE